MALKGKGCVGGYPPGPKKRPSVGDPSAQVRHDLTDCNPRSLKLGGGPAVGGPDKKKNGISDYRRGKRGTNYLVSKIPKKKGLDGKKRKKKNHQGKLKSTSRINRKP